MLYLLDANVLITANDYYYPIDRVPEFWSWLKHMGVLGKIKIPLEIFEEIKDGPTNGEKDLLFAWLKQPANFTSLILKEDVDIKHLQDVTSIGYGENLTDSELEEIGRDPFLIAYARTNNLRVVVTVEASKPSRKRQNRHIPDVCKSLGIRCCDPFSMTRILGFRTNWQHVASVTATAA